MVTSLTSSAPADARWVSRGGMAGAHGAAGSANTDSDTLSAPTGRWPTPFPMSARGIRYSMLAVAARRPRRVPPAYPRTGNARAVPKLRPNPKASEPDETPPTPRVLVIGPAVAPAARRSANTECANPPGPGTCRYRPARPRTSLDHRGA